MKIKLLHLKNASPPLSPSPSPPSYSSVLWLQYSFIMNLTQTLNHPPHLFSPPTPWPQSRQFVARLSTLTHASPSISSLNVPTNSDPEIIFKLSLQVSIKGLSNITSFLKTLNDVHSEPALKDCMTQFEDALTGLNDSVSEMEVGSGEKMLTDRKVNDVQTWISAAMTG
ncbi:hypothetical protein Patl1_17813 [Pistacia atlantica]|uniref:Uncharacterized protein n=1 Tax=Pistacia atlantica TaxID=434234 RepID=A0ACC1BYD9_9ROSI|nr:hypothetical protein Patl1_17813 [Pistacia atlantica]